MPPPILSDTPAVVQLSESAKQEIAILVAEDNPVNREVAAEMLETLGYRVQTVCNGREAVDAIAARTFDLVFMDCQMPVMDGFSATATIRAREKDLGLPQVPIVALTAHAIAGDRERCLAHGMDDYLSKPFRQLQLSTVVQRWVVRPGVPTLTRQEIAKSSVPVQQVHAASDCLDERALQDLRALRRPGRPDPVVAIMSQYVASSRQYIETLRQDLTSQNTTGIVQVAHSLKSSSAMIGALALAEHLKQLEATARAGDVTSLLAIFVEIEQTYDHVMEAIQEMLMKEAA